MAATPKQKRKMHKKEGRKMAESHMSSMTPFAKSRMSKGTVRRQAHKLAKGKSILKGKSMKHHMHEMDY